VDKISARSFDELLDKLRTVDIRVPPRAEARSTEQVERWSVCRFLSTYGDSELIDYPVSVQKRESPDFLLGEGTGKIGIEITEAIPPDWAWADAKRQRLKYDTTVLLHRFRPGEPRRSKKEIENIARGKNEGSVWAGYSAERDWADVMLHFALEKTDKAAKPGYAIFPRNWLLIYDNWPLPAVDEVRAARYFSEHLEGLESPLPFDRIFVECERMMWEFTESGRDSRKIRDVWNSS
jgi:hypothetical protein